ncbi:MAG: iron-containing alcohol dehydrogenase family protein, partial [Nocardioidaceae bacterium]
LAPSGTTAAELAAADDPGGPVPPIAAVPTTAGTGAETNGFGVIESADRRKVYLGSDRTVPALVVLDPALTVGLPATVTAASGFDAVIHGAESLLSRGATATSRAFAAESLRLTTSALARAVADGTDLEARSRMLTGAHLAGRALTLSGLGLVHGIGHSLTATLGTPHGSALATVVGPALRLGIDAHPAGYADLARALGLPDGPGSAEAAVQALVDLAAEVGLATGLADLDVSGDVVDVLADKTLDDPVIANSPVHPGRAQLIGLLRATAQR